MVGIARLIIDRYNIAAGWLSVTFKCFSIVNDFYKSISYFASGRGTCDECVCLCVHPPTSHKPHGRTVPNFLCTLPVAMTRSYCNMLWTSGFVADVTFLHKGLRGALCEFVSGESITSCRLLRQFQPNFA